VREAEQQYAAFDQRMSNTAIASREMLDIEELTPALRAVIHGLGLEISKMDKELAMRLQAVLTAISGSSDCDDPDNP
jgi:hypothetical protein